MDTTEHNMNDTNPLRAGWSEMTPITTETTISAEHPSTSASAGSASSAIATGERDGTADLTVVLRVARFTPRPERDRGRRPSPFGRSASPFGTSGAAPARPRARQRGRQWTQDYILTARPEDTLLDCLLAIKRTQDPTLAFRYSCGHGMCGSDAACVNGTPTLLCSATVSQWTSHDSARTTNADGFRRTGSAPEQPQPGVEDASAPTDRDDPPVIELSALPGFPVIRDLVVDIDPMLDQIRRLKPYLIHNTAASDPGSPDGVESEYRQTPQELSAYEVLTTCIACGVCEGSCPVYAGGEAFMGPAALIWASRFINDSRDDATEQRERDVDTDDGISSCQSVRACSRQCPQGIDVGEEMWQLIAKVREG